MPAARLLSQTRNLTAFVVRQFPFPTDLAVKIFPHVYKYVSHPLLFVQVSPIASAYSSP